MEKQKYKKSETLRNDILSSIKEKNVVFLLHNSPGTKIKTLKTTNSGETISKSETSNAKELNKIVKDSILVSWSITDFVKTNSFLKTTGFNLDGIYCFCIKNMCKDAFLNTEYRIDKNENKIDLLKMKVTYKNVTEKYFGLPKNSNILDNYKFFFFEFLDFYKRNAEEENLENAEVLEVWYWNGFNHYQSGWQVKTNLGMLNFRTTYQAWTSKDVPINNINVENIEEQICDKYNMGKFEFKNTKKPPKKTKRKTINAS